MMLDENNVLAQFFILARDRFAENELNNVKIKLIGLRTSDGRRYNLPFAYEVAGLFVRDIGSSTSNRYIVVLRMVH